MKYCITLIMSSEGKGLWYNRTESYLRESSRKTNIGKLPPVDIPALCRTEAKYVTGLPVLRHLVHALVKLFTYQNTSPISPLS